MPVRESLMPKRFFRSAAVVTALLGVFVAPVPNCLASQSQPLTDTSDQDKQLCTVAGTILSANTGEPLKKARVVIRPENENSARPHIATTDAQGRFTISGILEGRYYLWADRDGYQSKSYEIGESGRSSKIFALNPGQKIDDIVLRLSRYAAVSGRITDEDGDPAQRVRVEVVTKRTLRGKTEYFGAGESETNDLGEYRIFGVAAGKYTVRALPRSLSRMFIGGVNIDDSTLLSAGGYVPTYFPNLTDASRAATIELKSGDDVSGIDITLAREHLYRVRGHVTNNVVGYLTGSIEVGLLPANRDDFQNPVALAVQADEQTGEFEIRDVADGSYTVVASWRDSGNSYSGSESIQVAGADVDSVGIVITRGATIRGKVVLVGNAARARNLEVDIISRDRGQFGSRDSSDVGRDGTFQINGVSGGLYEVTVNSSCNTCYAKSVQLGTEDVREHGLAVSSNALSYELEVLYSEGMGLVEGIVSDDGGSPSPGTTVFLVPEQPILHPWRSRSEATDQYGHFIVTRIEPGNYHAVALRTIDDSLDLTDPQFLQRYGSNAVAVSIGENEKKSMRLTASAAPSADPSN
jgi:hypothetical protein